MNKADYLMVLEMSAKLARETFREKQQEYGSEEDVFANIQLGAEMAHMSPERFVFTLMAKHIAKLSRSCEKEDHRPEMWDEPIRDTLGFLHLLQGLSAEWPGNEVQMGTVPDGMTMVQTIDAVAKHKQPKVKVVVHQVEEPVFPGTKPSEVDFKAKGKYSDVPPRPCTYNPAVSCPPNRLSISCANCDVRMAAEAEEQDGQE